MPFRIGRKFAQHTYPQARATSTVSFARNSAIGPDTSLVSITDNPVGAGAAAFGTPVPWQTVESTAAPNTLVPITPSVTGRIRALATVVVISTAEFTVFVTMGLVVDSGAGFVPTSHTVVARLVPNGDTVTIPLVLDFTMPVGGPHEVALVLLASGAGASIVQPMTLTLSGDPTPGATLDLQELPLATG